MFNFTFTNRNEYMQQKQEWIQAYKEAVLDIRKAKLAIRHANRDNSSNIYSFYAAKNKANKHLDELLTARSLSREEANRQWLASKQRS